MARHKKEVSIQEFSRDEIVHMLFILVCAIGILVWLAVGL